MKFNKVFIISPSDHVTGGPHTLHQLCHMLNSDQLAEAYIYYMDQSPKVIEAYSKYKIKVSTKVEDSADNLIIVPEGLTYYLRRYKKIKKVVWWLSWDYYLRSGINYRVDYFMKKRGLSNRVIKFLLCTYLKKVKCEQPITEFEENIYHFYNCEYAHLNVLKIGVKDEMTRYLCGPLSEIYFSESVQNLDIRKKQNIICYNPAKGEEFTNKIIEYIKQKGTAVKFVAIKNMTPDQVLETLKNSKVYMDFGYFPGPERIPREAVMLKCNIITSQTGAANNDEDVKIPFKYKFLESFNELENIYQCVTECLINYEDHLEDFDEYRKKVFSQKNVFTQNVRSFFS